MAANDMLHGCLWCSRASTSVPDEFWRCVTAVYQMGSSCPVRKIILVSRISWSAPSILSLCRFSDHKPSADPGHCFPCRLTSHPYYVAEKSHFDNINDLFCISLHILPDGLQESCQHSNEVMYQRIIPVIRLIYNIVTLSFKLWHGELKKMCNLTAKAWWTSKHMIQEKHKVCQWSNSQEDRNLQQRQTRAFPIILNTYNIYTYIERRLHKKCGGCTIFTHKLLT